MDITLSVLVCFFCAIKVYSSVPPDICFEKFKWQDCGMDPKPVIYYYHSGSRCEVGMWRGCLPNSNMFVDEYDCVQTCIFSLRARPEDFHNLQVDNDIESEEVAKELPMITTVASSTDNSTGIVGEVTGAGGGETGGTAEIGGTVEIGGVSIDGGNDGGQPDTAEDSGSEATAVAEPDATTAAEPGATTAAST